jgi:negative regulator of sigma E activity
MGAMNAYGAIVDGHQVVVVGEVPAVTVEMMAESIGSRRDGTHD